MAGVRGKRFSIFDAMEDAGAFRKNPANPDSVDNEGKPLYKGPQKFPMLVYSPFGEERVIVPAVAENTPFGPKMLGEQRELIWQQVENESQLKAAIAAGWHDHPAKAHAAWNEKHKNDEGFVARIVPRISADQTISAMEQELEELKAKLAKAEEDKVLTAVSALPGDLKKSTSNKGLA